MKALLLVALMLVVCLVLFLTGLVSPRRSRSLEGRFVRYARKGERKGAQKAGRMGDATSKALKSARRAGEASARGGRSARSKARAGIRRLGR